MPKVLILQTCDGDVYKPLLDIAEPIHREYARKHGYDYRRFDGVIDGDEPWMSTFNRIFLLYEELQKGVYDWVLYMDADAIIIDSNKPLDEFIDDNDKVIVACRGATDDPNNYWDINIGTCFYNFKHNLIHPIISLWLSIFHQMKAHKFGNQESFLNIGSHLNDQDMLQEIIHRYHQPSIIRIYRGEQHNAFNYDSPFMKQILRSGSNTVADRVEVMKECIRKYYGKRSI